MDLSICEIPGFDLWLMKDTDRGPRYMLLSEAVRYLSAGQIPTHLRWSGEDIVRAWNSLLILPRGHDNRYLFNQAKLEEFRYEMKNVCPAAGQPPFGFGPLTVPLEVPLDTCRKFHVNHDSSFRHMMIGMPGTRETLVDITTRATSASRDSCHRLLFLPYRFHNARRLMPDHRPGCENWSNEGARETLGLDATTFFPLKILTWNSKGSSEIIYASTPADLVDDYAPTILIVLETHLPLLRSADLNEILPYNQATGIESVGLSGGVWVLWNSDQVSVVEKFAAPDQLTLVVRPVAAGSPATLDGSSNGSPEV